MEMLMDRHWTKKGQTNTRNYTQFQKEPSYDGDLSPCQV